MKSATCIRLLPCATSEVIADVDASRNERSAAGAPQLQHNCGRGLMTFWLTAFLAGNPLRGHVGSHPIGAEAAWWECWNADPVILANLALLAGCYAAGWRLLRAQRGLDATVRPIHAVAFAGGMAGLFIALVSPIDVLAVELQWVHMVQHMVLMNVAAPLIVLGAPVRTIVWLLPAEWRQSLGRGKRALAQRGVPRYLLWQPVLLWILYGAVLWIWHLPGFYEAALHREWIHDAQHLMFFAAACLFWRVMFDPIGRLRMSRGLAVVYLFTTSLHATLLGVFMAVAPRLWYETYADRTSAWGFAPLEDQQLAGYIMWMPACMAYAAVAAILFGRWLHEESARDANSAVIGDR
jgi:putative membrane protein